METRTPPPPAPTTITPTSIDLFVMRYRRLITHEDIQRLEIIKRNIDWLKRTPMIENRNGRHYVDCDWSCEETSEGPDTCYCCMYSIENELIKAQNIINMYNFVYENVS